MISEYDAFGPWVYEIDEEHPIPKLFVPYIKDDPGRSLMVKVPRQIDRQDATPDMDLYDYVIGVDSDYLSIYARTEGTRIVRSIKVEYNDVVAVSIKNVLLASEIVFMLDAGDTVHVPFNRLSFELMEKVIEAIRTRCDHKVVQLPDPVDPIKESDLKDTTFANKYADFKASAPNAKLGTLQTHIFMPPIFIPASLSMYNDTELMIVEKPVDYDPITSKYGYKITYIALSNLRGVEIKESREYDRLYEVKFKLRNDKHSIKINISTADQVAFYKEVFNADVKKGKRKR